MTYTINALYGAVEVSAQLLADVITTACDGGGIAYWCEVQRYVHTAGPEHTTATILMEEELVPAGHGRVHEITIETVRLGLTYILMHEDPGEPPENNALMNWSMLYRWCRDAVSDNDASIVDADCADAIIQYGLFKELVFA